MDRVMAGSPGFAYLDDVLVASADAQQHTADLRDVFSRLRKAGLVINAEKCQFAAAELDFLGHHVSAAGITPLAGRLAAIQLHPRPGTIQELMAFLGTINFYRRLVPAATILRPLNDALVGSPRPQSTVEWTPSMLGASQAAKDALAAATTLAHTRQAAEMALMVDASAGHVGASLQQRSSPKAGWQPLGFFSNKLAPAETRYSAFDRELLTCVAGIRHFRFMVEGRRFTLYTDHKPLTFALHKAAEPWTARQCRHLLDYATIAAAQRTCPSLPAAERSSLRLRLMPSAPSHPHQPPPSRHRRLPRAGPSRRQCVPPPHGGPGFLEGHGQGHHRLVQGLPGLLQHALGI
jgi:hypothetical protein